MLSRENPNQLSEEQLASAWRDAARAAQHLGQKLISFERHPDPKEHLNAPNPAHPGAVRIRLIRPQPVSIGYADADSVRDHNSYVSSLGREGRRFE